VGNPVKKYPSGWTLLQLLVGLAILGILATLALSGRSDYADRVKITQAKQDINVIALALDDMRLEQGKLPSSLADIGMGNMRDPWGNPYFYLNIQTAKGNGKLRKDRNLVPINTDYDLYSSGPDGKTVSPLTAKASQDDIIRAGDGSFIGVASEF
jgi:general secretion pathway protein G